MWTCPKCGREFQRKNQSHYCGTAPKTVDEYIEQQSAEARPHLAAIRNAIRESVPAVKESISWSMPYYINAGRTVSFAAHKKYVSFYAGKDAIAHFVRELAGYETKKDAVYFPYDAPVPADTVGRIAEWYLQESAPH